MAIRRGSAADAPAAAALYIRARRAAAEAGTIPPGIHDEEDVAGYLAARELWLAGGDGLLVLEDDWVAQLYVAPGREGHGIGSALLAVAKRERPAGLRLWAFQSNVGAQRFYERHGFAAVRRTDGAENEEQAPDVLYAWVPRVATVLADDLTGAADCGLAFLRAGLPTTVGLGSAAGTVAALDLDTRRRAPAEAADRVRDAVARAEGVLYKKLDSTLRGHVAEELTAAIEASGLPLAVVAPAFPAQGRTTRRGRAFVDGRPVGRPGLLDVLPGARLGEIGDEGIVVIDAETDDDLRAIVEAVGERPVLWAGSAGLAAHVAPTLAGPRHEPSPVRADGPVLIAVGTRAAQAQVDYLAARGVAVTASPAAARARLEAGEDVVLGSSTDVAGLPFAGLVVTGGATARAALEALGETTITLEGEVEPGIPCGRLGGGLPIVTKAGGFGGPATLEACRCHLRR